MFLGYNTNGFAHHRLEDSLAILAELGYQGVAWTPDVHDFPRDLHSPSLSALKQQLDRHGLKSVIETGARFLLDSRRKHQPTLLSSHEAERQVRFGFLRHCIDLAAYLDAGCVSFWSGSCIDDSTSTVLFDRLVEACQSLSDYAAEKQVRLAFEPEPGMFIDTMEKFEELHRRVDHPAFGLTLDVGHLVCMGELPIREPILRWKERLWNIHIEDMRHGVHDHLMFGEGEVAFGELFTALHQIGYKDMLSVELSRHSFDAVNTARKSRDFLRPFLDRR